ncbi:DUF6879 family protein [Streptomyces anulatus]
MTAAVRVALSEARHSAKHLEMRDSYLNVAAGEDVRWLPRSAARDLLLPALDGWVMDDRLLILHHFSGEGQWTGPGMEVCDDVHMAERYAHAYDTAWQRAIPHAEYETG